MASAGVAAGTKRKIPESSSISSSSSGIDHEVFLNFRDADTSAEFTDLLHQKLKNAGIEVFKDDEKLRTGEEISQGLKDAIKRSRISIAIFSKDYASSESCLMELVQMWECRESDGQTNIPIFYDVSPNDVKLHAGNFATSFEKHEKDGKVGANTIERWKGVLQLVGGLSGFERKNINGGHTSDLLEKVLTCVRQVLKKDDQVVTDKLVGIDLHVQEMMTKLGVVYSHGQAIEVCGGDVRAVGICGMPGVGKTTLAKVVFNKIHKFFDGCSFLKVINSEGVKVSQELLIADLQKGKSEPVRSSGKGIKKMKSLFNNMKIFIVLDDVHEVEQIEALAGDLTWFGPGSRIIVTTDNRNVLGVFDVESFEEYEVNPMSHHDALQLFRKHAFQGDAPQDVSKYDSLSPDIVEALGRLPLAIELQARYLKNNMKIQLWTSSLKSLKSLEKYPLEEKVEAAFDASYKSLDDSAKEIFLDIACFFIGKDERVPPYMWEEAWDGNPLRKIKDLRDMHLLEDGENNEIRMHNLLRNYGRKLVKKKVLHERCRIWNHSDALSILKDGQPNAHLEGISLPVGEAGTARFTFEALGKKLNLRYLRLDGANIEGNSENLLPNLRWLDWQECHFIPKLCDMDLKKLLILDLSWSPVTKYSQVWRQIMEKVKELRVLNLQGCVQLPASFNFPAPIKLEILILEDCTQLSRIGPFISGLENLSSLNLRNCRQVKELPPELACMKSLKELLIDGTGIKIIRIQEDSLQNLETLSACGCKDLKYISTIGHLENLTSLALDGAINWHHLETFEFPRNLRRLSLRKCEKLFELPPSMGNLRLLEVMDLSYTGITELPESVKDLKNLKTLKMEHTHLQKFPEDIAKLENLEEMDFCGCRSLGGQVHCDISVLSSLRILRLSSSNIALLPQGICGHSRLQTLDILQCNQLRAIPELPSSLLSLRWGSKNIAVPDLSYLANLKELCLNDDGQPEEWLSSETDDEQPEARSSSQTSNIEWIPRLPSLETLQLSVSKVTHLPGNFCALTQLRELSLSYMKELDLTQLPSSSLLTLRLKYCKIPEPTFSSLQHHLSELELDDCELAEIDGLKDLKRLVVLKIFNCKGLKDLDGLKNLKLLRVLDIIQGKSITNLDELKDVKQLKDGVETAIESMEKIKYEAGQRPVDMETSDRDYAIAAVQNLLGIDNRAKKITKLLEVEVNDEVRIIGIYGVDGIGKTTLAKAVYDNISSCFDSCSFLAEVEETMQSSGGIQFLRNKLIRDILEQDRKDPSLDEGIEDFLDTFQEMKVLIVVDAVEKPSDLHAIVGDQLHWFGPGSRVIVTSQNEKILTEYDSDKARTYKVGMLNGGQPYELFCKHAFRMQSSVPDYDGLSIRIVNATERLPLAVEVVSSFLRGKSIQEWEKMEKSMKERIMSSQKSTVGLEEILDICYKELGQQQKDIFLDIACFISGVDAQIASYMWPNCYPSSGCILMPLAIIGENNELQMHRLLRRLGKRMFEQEGYGDPIGRKFYIQEKGMENVEALPFDFTAGYFQIMPELRFLKLDNAKVSGNFEGAFASLRWLCWQRCPMDFSAENFVLTELVILDLSWSKVTEDWGGWSEIKMEKLKVLNLTGCSDLLFTPDFSGYKYLEILILERCSRLVKLDPSIGHLKCLVSLNLKFCSRLNRLPEVLGRLTALKELFIDGTSVRKIPISIGNLKQLKILSGLKCFPLTHLPSSICYLAALSELSLEGAKISVLPSSLGELLKLRRLSLRDCRYLEKLPYSIGQMASLEELDISATSISELPDSIKDLESLSVLRMDSSFIQAFPEEIWNLTKLKELHACWCRSLKGAIPSDIEGLHRLRSLTLVHSSISSLPPEISTISGLHTLDLIQCNEIEELPMLPSSLICLRVSSKRMKAIPPLLEDMKGLKELCLSDGDPKACRPSSKLPMPESDVKQMIGKQSFSIACPKLRKLELSLSQVFKLKFGQRGRRRKRRMFNAVHEFPKLSVFKLYDSAIEEIEGLEKLEALERLDISNCKIQNLNDIGQLTSLRSLILSDCNYLNSLPDLSNLTLLKVLEIRRCKMIRHIKGVEKLTSLKKLKISECPAENSVQVQNTLKDVRAHSVHWDFIKQGVISLKRSREEILLDTSNQRMKKMEDEARERPADVETSDRNCYAIAAVQNVVGIDDRAKQITDLLEMEAHDEVRIIGIYGTDGIGKTTLAKAVYKRISSCFDSCSFLAEVEEKTQNSHDIQFLQNKLIHDILERDQENLSFDERIEDFLDIFREMKVLIVVDDVEKLSDLHALVGDRLHWFGPGSRIIVTSKNCGILKEYDREKACNYMVSELDDGQAFEIFCKHAFGMQSSIPDYDGLPNCIVNATEKLPLAVEVVGSFLRGKSIQEWEKMEKSMKARTMNSQKTMVGLEEILDICYKELDQQQKNIFLDIACFISDVDAQIGSYMWPNCYLPSSGCILMPLAKIGEKNELQMHRLLRCFGKRIFKQEGSGDPSSRGFYTQDMVLKAMNREKGIENVEGRDSCFLTAASLASMPAISFLKLDGAEVSGDFAGAFQGLRWLCWQRCPLDFRAINFVLRELVILDLSWSKVTEDWRGWSAIKMEKLKVLNLTGCSDLLITPNFSYYKDLEILILEQCSHLVKLDPTIGHLKCLVSLNLKFCSQLNGLPVELGCATALKELFIDGTSVRQIPISIGNLKQLEILSGLKCFPLTHLPSSICYLAALSELSLDGAKISELPSSLGELLKLRRLSLRDCRYLEKLPYSIGEMGSLEELDISATCISELPDSIRNLKSLRVLRMDSSFIRAFPGEIGNLCKLEELHASWCRSLKGAIPGDIEGLHRLRSLTLGHSSISSLPPEISTISGLHTLDLIQCNKIEELPKLPPSLICLRVSSKRMKAIPLLEDMKELEELCLSDGDLKALRPPSKLPTPESNVKRMIDKRSFSILFPKLRKLELSLSQVIKLKFGLTDTPPLKRLKKRTPPPLSCRDVSELPKKLLAFKLYHSAIEKIEGLEGLEALKRLDISNCKIRNLNRIGQLTSLRSLILSDCDYLDRLPDLSNLKSLKVLEIIRCKMISQIEGLEKLTSLEKLNISECPAEKSVQVQDALKHVMARFPVT